MDSSTFPFREFPQQLRKAALRIAQHKAVWARASSGGPRPCASRDLRCPLYRREVRAGDLTRHFEQLFFPTPLEWQYMWYQGNHMHAYVGVRSFFRENISLTMIRIRLNLVSNIILYDSNQTHLMDVEYN